MKRLKFWWIINFRPGIKFRRFNTTLAALVKMMNTVSSLLWHMITEVTYSSLLLPYHATTAI